MRKGYRAALAFAAIVTAYSASHAQPQVPSGGSLPPGVLRVEVAEIVDSSGFGKPMTAARILVPSGWRTEGGVRWAARPCQEPATFEWSATSADGSAGVALYPAETWAAGSTGSGDCMPGTYETVRAYLEANVQRRVRGARVLDYRARPDLLEANKAYFDGQIQLISQRSGTGARAWADAGEILYAFQQNGAGDARPRVDLRDVLRSSELANPLGGAPLWNLSAGSFGVFSAYAQDGRLDIANTEAIRKSVKRDIAWTPRASEDQGANGAARSTCARLASGRHSSSRAAQRSRKRRSRRTRWRRVITPTSAARGSSSSTSATDDRMQRERIEAIRGVETYHDPVEGGSVQLDNTFDHAWRVNNQNAYILTNDPNFNPGLYDIEARELKVVQ